MNFGEMQSEVRLRLDESTANFWSNDDIKNALNEGLEELSDATEWYERSTNIPYWSYRTYYDLRHFLSDEFLAPKRALNTVTGEWIVPTSVRNQDARQRQWEKVTGNPEEMFVRGLWWMGFFPKPPNDSGTIRLYFAALPPDMTDDTEEPGIPEEYHQGIIEYAVYDLLAQDAETEKALLHWKDYLIYEAKLKDYVQGRVTTDKVGHLG